MAATITNVSGGVTHGSAVTLIGNSFGAKSPAAPLVWDPCNHTVNSHVAIASEGGWTDSIPSGGSAAGIMQYRATPYSGISAPHTRVNKVMAGGHIGANDYYGGNNVMFWVTYTRPSFPFYSYRTFYFRADDSWLFGGDNNFKAFDLSNGYEPYSPNDWYITYDGPSSSSSSCSWATGSGGGIEIPDRNGHNNYWGAAVNPMAGAWTKIECEICWTSNSPDGYIKLWENGVLRIDYAGVTDGMTGTQRSEAIGGYARIRSAENFRYYADIYYDRSRSRVLLGNASTFSSCTVREIQIPTTWADGSIGITVNQGVFTNGAFAWLYVVDSVGAVSVGFPVTIGGVSAPAAPTALRITP